ncbi:MarR family winged helix-turn-helix transcriptional regulator [Caballeronia sordidicola]|nr:MarR family transcriptional regulator [Caballeronia sordidicola]
MTKDWKNMDLRTLPGHYVRRLNQLVVALYMAEVAEINLTPVQYAILQTICNEPGIDQKTLARTIGYDTATIGSVIDRLESRGLVKRNVASHDRRSRLITPTEEGRETLNAVVPRMLKSQERFLKPLAKPERKEFMRLMKILIDANEELKNISIEK